MTVKKSLPVLRRYLLLVAACCTMAFIVSNNSALAERIGAQWFLTPLVQSAQFQRN